MINIILVDDHVVVRSGFAQLLSLEEDICVVGEFGSAAQALPQLVKGHCDIAILDIDMPDESGLSLLRRLRQVRPHFRAIFLSIYDTNAFVKNAVDAGASGYLTKRCGPEELVRAIRTVHGGGFYLCADALKALRQESVSPKALQELTPREKEVFDLLIHGFSAKEIAEKLDLSHKTVHVHRANILAKLACDSPVELVHFAIEHRLLPGH